MIQQPLTVHNQFDAPLHSTIDGFAPLMSKPVIKVVAAVIARDGTVLESYVAPQFTQLPLVVGQGAAERAAAFLALMDRYPAIRDQARAYVLVAERRWNMKLKNGLYVRLPEAQPERAIETLIALDRDKKILSRDITAIDLRLADRVTVRLSDVAAQDRNLAREEALKDKKTKRKAGYA